MASYQATIVVLVGLSLAGCGHGLYGNDNMEGYLQRKDTITMSAGDASRVNAVAHTINPWPNNVGDRRIPGSGARAVRAIECYEGRRAQSGTQTTTTSQTQTQVRSGSGGVTGTSTGTSDTTSAPKTDC